jgi:hypothetical protein
VNNFDSCKTKKIKFKKENEKEIRTFFFFFGRETLKDSY